MASTELNILCFGPARECAGGPNLRFQAELPCKVGDLRRSLLNAFPQLGDLNSLRIAVDQSYSSDDQEITGNEEIALIMPVSGG